MCLPNTWRKTSFVEPYADCRPQGVLFDMTKDVERMASASSQNLTVGETGRYSTGRQL